MKKHLLFLVLLCLASASCGEKRTDIIYVDSGDAEMNAAMEKGRKTFDLFKQEFKKNPEFGGLIKVYFTQDGSQGEHMWVQPLDLEGDKMTGILLDVPDSVTNVKRGDKVAFSLDRVTDWLYIRDGKAVGAFSVRVLRDRMSESERKEHDAGYPFSFD